MDAMGARHQRRQRVGDGQPAVAMSMPVDTNFFPRRLYDFIDYELDQCERAHRRGVAGSVADYDGAGAAVDCRRVELLDRIRIATGGVLGDVHGIEAERDRVLDRSVSGLEQEVVGPSFGETTDGARSNESCGFDAQAGFLDDLGDWPDVIFMGARGTVGANLHLVRDDLAGQRRHRFYCTRPRARQAEIE